MNKKIVNIYWKNIEEKLEAAKIIETLLYKFIIDDEKYLNDLYENPRNKIILERKIRIIP